MLKSRVKGKLISEMSYRAASRKTQHGTAAHLPLRKNRDFTTYWIGQAASRLGSRMSFVAYPLLILALTKSPVKAGIVGFANNIPWILFSLHAGVLVDRWNRKTIMLVCDAMRVLALASIAVALGVGKLTFWQVAIVAFIEGTFVVGFSACERGVVRRFVARDQMMEAVARSEAKDYGAYIIGPAAGGTLFDIEPSLPFLADAVSYIASFASLWVIRTPFQEDRYATRKISTEIHQGILWLYKQPFLRTCALLAAGGNFIINALYLTVIVAARNMGTSAGGTGLVVAAGGVGGVLGAIAAPWILQRLHLRTIVAAGYWFRIILLPGLAYAPNAVFLALLFALALAVPPIWNAGVVGYRTMIVPDELQGRVQSASSLAAQGMGALGPLAAGIALTEAGTRGTLLALWIISLLLAIWGSSNKSVRNFVPEKTRDGR